MLLPALLSCLFAFPSITSASDDFSGPIDPTGLVDFSGATACACPGSSVQYYCTVNDPSRTSTTRWRGSAFICTGNDASLFHSDYMSGSAADPCTDGGFNLIARGLTNITDNCYTSVLSVIIVPGLSGRTVECTSAGIRIIGNDTLQVSVPLPPPSSPVVEQVIPDQSFTVSWTPPPNDCGNAVNYTYLTSPDGSCGECTNIMTSQVSTTCTGWTAREGQSCSISARANNCGGEGNVSEPVIISFPRPAAPTITGGEVAFDQSRNISTVTVELEPVEPTTAIAMSDGGILLDGVITDYLANFTIGGLSRPVEVICSNTTCISPQLSVGRGGGVFVKVLARNAITGGEASQALCRGGFQVTRVTGTELLDVTLVCPTEAVGGCTIRYGVDPSYQTLPFEVRSGEPLQNLTAGQTYYTEATYILSCGPMLNITVFVRDGFDTCECPPSALFPGATPDPADTCPEYTGGVRSGEDGRACYDGLTGGSTAVFICDTSSANCSGSCEAVCNCSTGTTEGLWSASFGEVDCFTGPTPGPPLSAPEDIVGLVIGIVGAGVLILAIVCVVAGLLRGTYCKKQTVRVNNKPAEDGSPLQQLPAQPPAGEPSPAAGEPSPAAGGPSPAAGEPSPAGGPSPAAGGPPPPPAQSTAGEGSPLQQLPAQPAAGEALSLPPAGGPPPPWLTEEPKPSWLTKEAKPSWLSEEAKPSWLAGGAKPSWLAGGALPPGGHSNFPMSSLTEGKAGVSPSEDVTFGLQSSPTEGETREFLCGNVAFDLSSSPTEGETGVLPSEDVAFGPPSSPVLPSRFKQMDIWDFLLWVGLALLFPGFGIIIAVILLILRYK